MIDFTLHNLDRENPRLLPPSILMTAASEDERLRAELGRLNGRYQIITRQRHPATGEIENLAMNGEARSVLKAVASVRKLVRRCDRITKQLYICNDQIRQIEIQSEEHVLGALRYASNQVQSIPIRIHDEMLLPYSTVDISNNTATPTSSILASPCWTPQPTDLGAGADAQKTEMAEEERMVHFRPDL